MVHVKGPEVFPLISNSVDPDEVPLFARFHHCLQNCLIMGFKYTKGLMSRFTGRQNIMGGGGDAMHKNHNSNQKILSYFPACSAVIS